MRQEIATALRMTLVTLVLTGLVYPAVVTGLAESLFPKQALGSLVSADGRVVGSELIGQSFKDPAYFQGRPSAAGMDGYDATSSTGSNLGPTSAKLRDRVAADLDRLRRQNPAAPGPVPIELVTASGSGLDPHISPVAALWQVPRVARTRGVDEKRIEDIVRTHTEGRPLGLLGEPRVNVLLVNLALDRDVGRASAGGTRAEQ